MRDPSDVAAAFARAFGRDPAGGWQAPGRINLIGEHTDYNDGFVLPLALSLGVVCAGAARDDATLVCRSAQRPEEELRVELSGLAPGSVPGWGAYVAGVAWALADAGHRLPGADLLVDGDVPAGAGLGSSAALGCAVALALCDLAGLDVTRTELAVLARRAENDFVGAPTGIMDQLVALHGEVGRALHIDTRTLALTPVPLPFEPAGLALLVTDTGVRHQLVDGGYAARRRDCEQAAARLGVPALRDLTPADLDGAAWQALPDRLRRRARHVVTEDDRVARCVALLTDGGDPRRIGPLLTASHRSLRDDFEVTIPQLDAAVDAALAAGAHGARMTGGGFGGCTISLVERDAAADVAAAVRGAFARHGWPEPATATVVG